MTAQYHIIPSLLNEYLLPGTIIGHIENSDLDTQEVPLLLGDGLRAAFYEAEQKGSLDENNLHEKNDDDQQSPAPLRQRIPIRVTQCGYLRQAHHQNIARFHIESGSKSLYIPKRDQPVIAQVAFKSRDFYVLRLTATASLTETGTNSGMSRLAELAKMDQLAFDGASKRNKPNLQVGAWVYARVIRSDRDLDTLLTCETPDGIQKRDWVYADRVLFGELKGGWVVELADMAMCEQLLSDKDGILAAIGEVIGYDVVVGANGRVWVNAQTPQDTIIVGNVLKNIGMIGWSKGFNSKEERVKAVKDIVDKIKEAAEDQKERMDQQMESFLNAQTSSLNSFSKSGQIAE